MEITSATFARNQRIPEACAFGIPDPVSHMRLGQNRNPQLQWSRIPDEARSLVLFCVDTDVPSSMDEFNKEGRTVPAGLPRVDFFHWIMVDIPPTEGSIGEGECSDGIILGGKDNPPGPQGSKQGINDYTGFMADNPEMKGDYYGYDGPCPPWNDEILHHYHFILYAIDLNKCPVGKRFTAQQVQAAIDGHVLAKTQLTGIYALNPDLT